MRLVDVAVVQKRLHRRLDGSRPVNIDCMIELDHTVLTSRYYCLHIAILKSRYCTDESLDRVVQVR